MLVSFNTPKDSQIRLPVRSQRSVSGQKSESFLEKGILIGEENREVPQKQSGRLDAWIEKNGKNFDKLMGGGVSTDKPVNWDADGTSKLTQEQIDYLKSTYDFSDMSKQDYYDLMADLTNMNAISIEDAVSQYVKPIVPGVVTMSASVPDIERGFGHMNNLGDLKANLLQYMQDLDSMRESLLNGHSSMSSTTFFEWKDYLDDEKARAERWESLLNLIA